MRFLVVGFLILLTYCLFDVKETIMMVSAMSPMMEPMIEEAGVLQKYKQPDDVGRNRTYDNLRHNDGYLCARDCCKYPEPRICFWQFYLEQYTAMGPACLNCSAGNDTDCYRRQCIVGDGVERMVKSINRMIPGPQINCCYNDTIVVDVMNMMESDDTTIHWHGILQQESPWMDGVPYVTQCPIAENNRFRYTFKAQTDGTNFYHSHVGKQLQDGIASSLVVRTCEKPKGYCEYDYDLFSHTIILNDWDHFPADSFFPGYYKEPAKFIPIRPAAVVINGLGSYSGNDTAMNYTQTNTPHAKFYVKSGGYRYLFRIVVVGASNCPVLVTFQDHTMTLCAVDGYGVAPRQIESAYLAAGMRLDVVITTKKQKPKRSYNIVVKSQSDLCIDRTPPQSAILVYDENEDLPTKPYSLETVYNRPYFDRVDLGCQSYTRQNSTGTVLNYCSTDLRSLEPVDPRLTCGEPDYVFVLNASAYTYTYPELFANTTMPYKKFYIPLGGDGIPGSNLGAAADWLMNNISFGFPYCSLLTDKNCLDSLPRSLLCRGVCHEPLCHCTNVLKVRKDAIVELRIYDNLNQTHPFHLHGHFFTILAQYTAAQLNRTNGDLTSLYRDCSIRNPVHRDMVFTPSLGLSVIRFKADNPGMWFFHCHFENHLMGGMALVFEEGDYKKLPIPENFPRCGPYMPPVPGTYNQGHPYTCGSPSTGYNPTMSQHQGQSQPTGSQQNSPSTGYNPTMSQHQGQSQPTGSQQTQYQHQYANPNYGKNDEYSPSKQVQSQRSQQQPVIYPSSAYEEEILRQIRERL